jgi:hypothetical protein
MTRTLLWRVVAACVIWSVVGTDIVRAQPPGIEVADDGLAEEVKALVEQLDSDTLAEREAAEVALLELGSEVLDNLPRGEELSAEAAERVARVRDAAERKRSEEFFQASLVDLPQRTMPLSGALEQLQFQTGNAVVDFRGQIGGQQQGDPRIPLKLEGVSFWEALDQILDRAKMNVYGFTGEQAVSIVARDAGDVDRYGRGTYVGPFRLEAIEASARRNLRRTAENSLSVTIEAAWEPRIIPIALQHAMDDLEAVDDEGHPLLVANDQQQLEMPINVGVVSKEMALRFETPPRSASSIASLKGTLTALIPGAVEEFRFDKLANGASSKQSRADVTVTLQRVEKNGEIWEVRIRVAFGEAGDALESHRGWIYDNEAFLEGPDNQIVPYIGFEATGQSDNEVGVAYLFDLEDGPEGHTFVYRTPAAIHSAPIRYELKDIPLP